jgi:hypothetical protein
MSVNRYRTHVIVIPEDDADRQLAVGFLQHATIDARAIQVMPLANGWARLLDKLRDRHIDDLRRFPNAHVVLLMDFDDHISERRQALENVLADFDDRGQWESRVYLLGSATDPEQLARQFRLTKAKIGEQLAEECDREEFILWENELLAHNRETRERLALVKGTLFGA